MINNNINYVETCGLRKRYDGDYAVHNLDLSWGPGEIIGLVGRNGCGKSTFLKIVMGLVLPHHGTSRVFGTESAKLTDAQLERIGYVHQEADLPGWLTAGQLLELSESVYPNWNSDLERRLVKGFRISRKKYLHVASPGERQRIAFTQAVCHNASLLLLDEPGAAMDPESRGLMLEVLEELIQRDGTSIVISTHLLEDVERICDRMVFMKEGSIHFDSTRDDLLERFSRIAIRGQHGLNPEAFPLPYLSTNEESGERFFILDGFNSDEVSAACASVNATWEKRPLSLEALYPALISAASIRQQTQAPE